jgi:hypothetical protein
MRARLALEQAVHWLYDYDRSSHRPYDRGLHSLLIQPTNHVNQPFRTPGITQFTASK